MATTYRNPPSRPVGRANVPKARTKKVTPRPTPSTSTNKPNEIKTRVGNKNSRNSMNQQSSILKKTSLKKTPLLDQQFDETMINYKAPTDLQPITSRPMYSPIHTPPRLRRLITPPGLEPYRNNYSLRGSYSPLPAIDNWYTPPVGMNTWALDPSDYRFQTNSMRRYPSPLYRYSLGSSYQKQKKEPSDYVYVRTNEAFANHFIEDFIGKCIEEELLPDILLEIVGELEQESKTQGGRSHTTNFDQYYAALHSRMHRVEPVDRSLYSDHLVPPPAQSNSRLRYRDLPPDVQARLLAEINQELIDYEVHNMLTDLTGQTITDTTPRVPVNNNTKREVVHHPIHKVPSPPKQRVDPNQHHSMEKYAQNRLLDTMCLDRLLIKYLKQTGSNTDVNDLSRLLDNNILENLIHQFQNIDENRARTLDNYGTRKFHLNSHMNVTMDLLLTELSASLIEDMKDLDEREQS